VNVWEYRREVATVADVDDVLERLGAVGWELVSVLDGKAPSSLGRVPGYTLFVKRLT
jgi:hypothetical protein